VKGRLAGLLLLGIGGGLALLLLARAIDSITGAVLFAVALVLLGVLSEGFRRT
jgi:hypothetical protein